MSKKLEHKQFPLEAKEVDLEASTFVGFSAAIGNLDEANDRIMPGAFSKTISERVAAGRVKLLDQHPASNPFRSSTEALWGVVLEASEEKLSQAEREQLAEQAARPIEEAPTHGLRTLFHVSKARPAQEFLVKVSEGIADALSIGFNATNVEFIPMDDADDDENLVWLWLDGRAERQLKEIAWWETSGVIFGANPFALVLPGTLRELKRFAETADVGQAEAQEIRAIVYALQKMAPGCPTQSAVDDLLPRVERMADHLEAVKAGLTDDLMEKADQFTASLPPEHTDRRAIQSFVRYVEKSGRERDDATRGKADESLDSQHDLDTAEIGVMHGVDDLAKKVRELLVEVEGLAGKQAAGETPPEGRPEHLPEEKELIEAELAKLSVLEAEMSR